MRDAQWVMTTLKLLSNNTRNNPDLKGILDGCLMLVMELDAKPAENAKAKIKRQPVEVRPGDDVHAKHLPKEMELIDVINFLDHRREVGLPFWREHDQEWYLNYLHEKHGIMHITEKK